MKTVSEILQETNKHFEFMKGVRLNDSNDFHQTIIREANKILAPYNLTSSTWFVRSENNKDLKYTDIFDYTKSLINRDKRVKFGMVGRVEEVIFSPSDDSIPTNINLDEYLNDISKKKLNAKIELQEKYISELTATLENAKKTLSELKSKI